MFFLGPSSQESLSSHIPQGGTPSRHHRTSFLDRGNFVGEKAML